MLYKPTYCCSCGDKIERIEWRLLSSRRFCELCETQYKFDDWLPRIAGAFAVLIGIWGAGTYFSSSAESIDISNPRAIASSKIAEAKSDKSRASLQDSKGKDVRDRKKIIEDSVKRDERERQSKVEAPLISETIPQPVAKRIDRGKVIRDVSEPGYYCGAETKKGTPCSRKVKGKKRCWQHEGREAMLPQSKLAVGGKN